jgi:hypothetical protein
MKGMFKLFAFLYMIIPLIVIPYWAYANANWYLLFGILFSYFGSYTSFSPRLKGFTPLFLLLCIGVWIGKGFSIHQYITFFFFCSLWGYIMAKIAEEYDQQSKRGTFENDTELAAYLENNPEYFKEQVKIWIEAHPDKKLTYDVLDALARGREVREKE